MTRGSHRIAPRLLALTDSVDWPACAQQIPKLCAAAAPGSLAVVLRDRQLSIRALLEWGRVVREQTQEFGQFLFVSDRVDLTLALGADGLHLPADGLLPSVCRRMFGGWISRSAHGITELGDEDLRALSAVLISPVCAPRKGREALGFDGFKTFSETLSSRVAELKIYALGGVSADSAAQCLEAGAFGVAAIGACWDPAKRAEFLGALQIAR